MNPRRSVVALVACSLLLSCHDSTSTFGDQQRLLAVNGSTFPVVRLGDTVVIEGSGFGSAQANGSVLFGTGTSNVPAPVISWTDDQLLVSVPSGATSGLIVVSPDTGSAVGPIPVLISPPAVAFSPATFNWIAGPALPVGLRAVQLSALTYPSDTGLTARLHATAGSNDTTVQLTTLFSSLTGAGPAAWVQGADPLPTAYVHSASATATQSRARLRRHPNRDSTVEGVSYLLGGMDGGGRVVSDVSGMSVWENGDEGAWTRLTALPEPRAASAAAVAYGNLYVVGGFGPDSIALASTRIAVIDSFGAPTGWIDGPPLPEGRAFAATVIHNHVMYLIGGETGHIDPSLPDTLAMRPDVFAIRLSPLTGFFVDAGWFATVPLSGPRSRHAAFDVDAGILVSVGLTASGAPESEFASFTPDGSLNAFAPLTAPTIASLAGSSISEVGYASYTDHLGLPHVVLVGGVTASGGLSSQVWWH